MPGVIIYSRLEQLWQALDLHATWFTNSLDVLGRESSPGLSVPDLVDDRELASADLLAIVVLRLEGITQTVIDFYRFERVKQSASKSTFFGRVSQHG